LFVEVPEDMQNGYYYGYAQHNGTTIHHSRSLTGDGAESRLMNNIDIEADEHPEDCPHKELKEIQL
jgi:hypothetical protein